MKLTFSQWLNIFSSGYRSAYLYLAPEVIKRCKENHEQNIRGKMSEERLEWLKESLNPVMNQNPHCGAV